VGCPETCIFESREYLKSVVTVYELSVALGGQWEHGTYELDMRGLESTLEDRCCGSGACKEDEEEAYFSLATGTLVQRETDVGKREDGTVAVYSSADFLNMREFKGLETMVGQTPVVDYVEGRSGIAKGYTHETDS
jgi:diphthamide biosynthesis protein 2